MPPYDTKHSPAVVIYQQPRPGPPLPKGEYYITIGWKQIWHALKQYRKLPFTFVYLFAFFLLADVRMRVPLHPPLPPIPLTPSRPSPAHSPHNHRSVPLPSLRPTTIASLSQLAPRPQGLNTTGTLVSICQNDKFEFSFLQNTYLGLSQAITSTISTLGFWYIQKYWKIGTKKMVSGFQSRA